MSTSLAVKEPRSFTSIELTDVIPSDDPLVLDSNVKGDEAQVVLTTNIVHSAPVYDTVRKSIVGMFGWSDYGAMIVREVTARARRAKQTLMAEADDTVPLEIKSPIAILTDLSGRNPCVCLPPNTLLKDAMLTLAKGTHRLMVTDTGRGECRRDQIRGMLTQLSAIRYLYREGLLEHEQVMNMTMADLKLAHSKVTPRGLEWKTTSAIDALRTLEERGQDSLPLVENNELVSTLEWSDFEPLFAGHDYRQYQLMNLHELKLKSWQQEDVAVMAKTASSMASQAKQMDASTKQRYALRPVVPPARRSLERGASSANLGSPSSSLSSSNSTTSIGIGNVVTSKKGHTREASFSANKLSEEDLRAALGRVLAPPSPSNSNGSNGSSFLPPVRGASTLPSSGSNATSSPPPGSPNVSITIATGGAPTVTISGLNQSPAGSPNTSPRARGRRLARKPSANTSTGLSPPQSPVPQPAHLPHRDRDGPPSGSPVTGSGGGSAISLWKNATMSAAAAAAAATNNGASSTPSHSLLSANSASTPVNGRSRANSGAKPTSRPSSRPASPTRTPGTPSNGNASSFFRSPSLLPTMQSSSSAATLSVSSDSIMSPPQRRSLGPSGGSTASIGSSGGGSEERKRSRRTDSASGGLLDADAFFKLAKEKIDAVHRKRLAAVYITPQTTLASVIDRLIAAHHSLRSLWVVASDDKLNVIGSVGPTEILQILVSLYTRTGPAILNTPPVSPTHVVVLPPMATGTPGGNTFSPHQPTIVPPLFPKTPVTITVSQHNTSSAH